MDDLLKELESETTRFDSFTDTELQLLGGLVGSQNMLVADWKKLNNEIMQETMKRLYARGELVR